MTRERDIVDPNRSYPNVLLFIENSVLAFLQSIFATLPAGGSPRMYHYDDDAEQTEIDIEGQGTDNLSKVDVRPKIVVARGPVAWNQTHIGNFVGSQNLSSGFRRYTGIYQGTVGISCFSREDLEADHIAQICFDTILKFQFVLHKFGFLTIKAAQIGQRGLIKQDARPDLSVTPVLIKVEVASEWTARAVDAVKLRKILVQLTNPIDQSLEV